MKAMRKTTDQWLTITQAAHVLGVNHMTLRRACDRGTVDHHRPPPGRFRRIPVAEVRRLLAVPRYAAQREAGYERLQALLESGEAGRLQSHTSGEYLTTTQAARIMRCASRTVAALLDAGTLPGWRSGHDRRIYPPALRAYMEQAGFPAEWIAEIPEASQAATHRPDVSQKQR